MSARASHRLKIAAVGLSPRTLAIAPISPAIGAEVSGVDLSKPLEAEQLAEIRQALNAHHVLVFRDQALSRDDHKRFGRLWGRLHVHPYHSKTKPGEPAGDPEILPIKADANSRQVNGEEWHADVTCHEEPPMGSMLYLTRPPEIGCGGDTLFASTVRAFDALSEPMQRFLETLTAVHEGAKLYTGLYDMSPPEGGWPKATHPLITRHPETGRKILYVNRGFTTRIPELSKTESAALLEMLFRHVETNVEFQCRVRWTPNTLVFWDNRATQHCAVWDYFPASRYGERVSIIGERPSA